MCACMPMCFQRNLVTFAKARPAQMIFSSTSNIIIIASIDISVCNYNNYYSQTALPCQCSTEVENSKPRKLLKASCSMCMYSVFIFAVCIVL